METFIKYKNIDVDTIYFEFLKEFQKDELLKKHRGYIVNNDLGFGEDPYHVMWREIIKEAPKNFKFIEIGVYKGQILSLVNLLSKHFNKNSYLLGVSPLINMGDRYSNYDDVNYKEIIINLFNYFNIEIDFDKNFICGSSTDEKIKNKIKSIGIFDIVYVDGCHNYNCVISDINLAKEITKINSLIVFDDAACYKETSRLNAFKGHIDVCDAIKNEIEIDENYEEIICVGHNRVFKRIK